MVSKTGSRNPRVTTREREPGPASLMSMSRFEAFSDGVFAVAATLLVLDLKTLELAHADVASALVALGTLWRPLLSFATSFLVVGVIWLNHHTLFHAIGSVDRSTVVLNLVLLLMVALIPFPTALLATYRGLWPFVALYGVALSITGIAYNVLWIYVRRRYSVVDRIAVDRALVRRSNVRSALWPIGYALAAAVAPRSSETSIVIYAAIPVFFLFPSPVEAHLQKRATTGSTGRA